MDEGIGVVGLVLGRGRRVKIFAVLLVAALWAMFGIGAFGATYTVPALNGASIQSTINTAFYAGSNNTVLLPAGIYNVGSAITVPCTNGLTITGPVATPATAVLNATFSGNYIFNMSGCAGVTIEYLLFQANGGTGVGGMFVSNSNNSNISIVHNQVTGLPSDSAGNGSSAVYLSGNINSVDSNITIEYNTFGDATSCSAVFSGFDNNGTCAGLQTYVGDLENLTIQYNTFYHVSEGAHFNQIAPANSSSNGLPTSVNNGLSVRYNYFLNWHRIAVEDQANTSTATQLVEDNVFAYPLVPFYGTFGISMACCSWGRIYGTFPGYNPSDIVNDNLLISNTVGAAYGIEWWGVGVQGYNDLVEGPFGFGFAVGYGLPPWGVQNNYVCGTASYYYANEEGLPNQASMPTNLTWTSASLSSQILAQPGAGATTATCAQQTSVAPSISPASGSYTSPPTVTLTDTGLNTSIYYTVDGSTPVPGSGTTRLYTGPFQITLPAMVKSVGMWGVAPQPLSYTGPYGFLPSAVQGASYTATGGVTLASVALSNIGTVHSLVAGSSIQMTATCTYSDGSTTNCNTTDSHGISVSSWSSSNAAVSISSSGLATGSAVGSANLTATVASLTTPNWAMAVTSATVPVSSVTLATTGGVTTLVATGANQLLATCTYTDSSTTNCATTDIHGNVVNPWTSTAPSIATVSSSGVVRGVAAGSTNLTASVTPSMVTSQWGQTGYSAAGATNSAYINSTYFVFGSQPGGYAGTGGTCSFYLPAGTLTNGSLFDCGLIPAPTPTTQASSWLCWGTYTVSSTTAPGAFVTVPMNSCGGTIADGTAEWVAVATNSPGSPSIGFDNCGSSCSGSAPTLGNGTYPYRTVAVPYGTRTGMPTAMLPTGSTLQESQYVTMGQPAILSNTVALTVTGATPRLVSAYLTSAGSVSTITVGGTLQFAARCVYSDGSTTDCTVADIYGNAVTIWTTGDAAEATISAVGSADPGLVTAVAAGTPNISANIGSLVSSAFPLTVDTPSVTLTALSLATTNGVTGLFVGSTNALIATCLYSDGSTTNCTSLDSHGTVAGSYSSSAPADATVNATSGLVTGIAAGTTTLTATAGGVSSSAIPLTVLAVPSGTYSITITGPVSFSGTVQF